MTGVILDLRNPVDVNIRWLWLGGNIELEEVDFYRRCIEKGLRTDFLCEDLHITTKIPDTDCPYCGRLINAATGVDVGTTPSPGAVSICFYCGEILVFTDTLSYRKPTPEELIDITTEAPILNRLQKGILVRVSREKIV